MRDRVQRYTTGRRRDGAGLIAVEEISVDVITTVSGRARRRRQRLGRVGPRGLRKQRVLARPQVRRAQRARLRQRARQRRLVEGRRARGWPTPRRRSLRPRRSRPSSSRRQPSTWRRSRARRSSTSRSRSAVPYVVSVDQAAQQLAQKYGAKWVEYTNQGTPTQWTAGINQAIAQHANVIILAQGIAVSLIVPAMEKAKAAGIPIVITHDFQNGQQNTAPPTGPGADVTSSHQGVRQRPVLGGGSAGGRLRDRADQRQSRRHDLHVARRAAVERHHRGRCRRSSRRIAHACKVTVIDVPLADWATQDRAGDAVSDLCRPERSTGSRRSMTRCRCSPSRASPPPARPGRSTSPPTTARPAVMKLIQDGGIMSMDVGENITWLAYATLDQVGRVLTGAPIIASRQRGDAAAHLHQDQHHQAGNAAAAGRWATAPPT